MKNLGPWIFWGLALLSLPLWMLSDPETSFRHNLQWILIYSSQAAAIFGTALLALTFVLSTRSKFLESYFGGIDKMYQTHHHMGITAVILLVLHPVLLAMRWIPGDWIRVVEYLFPLHRRLSVDLGSWSIWGLIILILLTVSGILKYDRWKISHKFTGIFFILGLLHIWLLDENIMNDTPLLIYFCVLSVLGTGGYIYKTWLFPLVIKTYRCTVERVDRFNDEVMEITLRPGGERPPFIPGQFYFFSFRANYISKESHPFTIISSPDAPTLTIMVKALGDYTKKLYQYLQHGADVFLEGPYGRFNFTGGSQRQLWIGGGVGIAPFISWSRVLNATSTSTKPAPIIDLYYCINSSKEALFWDELKQIGQLNSNFSVHLISAEQDGMMDISKLHEIDGRDVFICGPKPMIRKLTNQLRQAGVPRDRIHYENFDFS